MGIKSINLDFIYKSIYRLLQNHSRPLAIDWIDNEYKLKGQTLNFNFALEYFSQE